MKTFDMHTHFLPKEWTNLSEKFGGGNWPWLRHIDGNKGMLMLGQQDYRPVYSACWDIPKRLEEMDRDAIDIQLMCVTPLLFAYHATPEQSLYCAQIFNDAALDMCSESNGRIMALAQVPLQDIDLACQEVSRAMETGHLGVQIGNHVGDKNLDDSGILTFLHHCADIGAAVLVHPWDMMGTERMQKYMLPWLVSMPAETQLSILSLILSGAFEKLPQSLRICFAHGGGSFAYLLGRVDNAWTYRDIVRESCPNLPSSYVDRFYVDSAIFDHGSLKLLTDVMGDNNVVFGTDYPFPLGEQHMGQLIRTSPNHTDDQKAKMLYNNSIKWLNL